MSGFGYAVVKKDGRMFAEYIIREQSCCGIRTYHLLGTPPYTCVKCGQEVTSDNQYEPFLADITPVVKDA